MARACPACKSTWDVVFITDPDGVWLECNDCGNFGYVN